jgi:GNAT superfamily N-acetyltransferase
MNAPVSVGVVTYKRERWSDALRDEAYPLLKRHWEEVALDKDTVPLDPNWAMYAQLDGMELLVITTARLDGELIGYVSHFIIPNLHYLSLKVADNDIFWLAPEHRNSRIGINLLRASERLAVELGCNKIIMKEKLHVPLGRLFEFLGYREIERIHAKTLIGAPDGN